jgi:hypothetical protein
MRSRILLFLLGLVLVPSMTYLVILFAKGYRPNFGTQSLNPTGIIAATSLPEGAEIYIDGQLKAATDSNFNLAPGAYKVEIKKDTYSSWEKTLTVTAEEVTRAYTVLFPKIPSLKAVTTDGAEKPLLSPDGTKVAYLSNSKLYVIDLSESPLGLLNRDSKLIFTYAKDVTPELTWSPDSRQILSIASPSATLVDVNSSTTRDATLNYLITLNTWAEIIETRENQKLEALPLVMRDILATSAASLAWSPRENKLLYTATASATIPDELIRPLPGSSTQVQKRQLEAGMTYVYDLEEDRNFQIKCAIDHTSWFPTSNHVICLAEDEVTIMEYDGLNPTVVYAGPMENGFAFPYPSSKQLLILSNLNSTTSLLNNLYALSLR